MELENLLDKLKLDHLEHQLDAVCEQAAHQQLDYKTFLVQALQTEWQGRFQSGIEARLKFARFPWINTGPVEFEFQPSLTGGRSGELAGMSSGAAGNAPLQHRGQNPSGDRSRCESGGGRLLRFVPHPGAAHDPLDESLQLEPTGADVAAAHLSQSIDY
jgi:hypothetical protein